MSKADFIERVAASGDLSKAEAKRVVELVFGEIEAGLKASKKEGKYTSVLSVHLPFPNVKHAWAAIRGLAKRSRSKHLKLYASVQRLN